MLITDILLLDYKRCQRRAFLNIYGNSQAREPARDFLLKLRQENQRHIQRVLRELYPTYQIPAPPSLPWQERVRATLNLMRQGVDCIYQGVLSYSRPKTGSRAPLTLVSFPHLLVKYSVEADESKWLYLPVGIPLGRRAKTEYKIIASLHAQLLAHTQGVLPATAELVLRPQKVYQVDLAIWIPRMEATLQECEQILSQPQEPEVFISRQKCNLCHWHSHCYRLAQAQQHLSLVPGVTPHRYQSLQVLGLNSLQALATAPTALMDRHFSMEVSTQLQQQAQSLLENRAIRKLKHKSPPLTVIPTNPVELYFDIEAEPELNLDYLLGVLLVNRTLNSEYFYSFLAQNPEDEATIWQEFLTFINTYPDAPIFHYSEYEVETLKRLGNLYNAHPQELGNLVSRCVDLHRQVIDTVILPVENYSLKSLANWLGFQWRDAGASGDQCVCWYDRWLKTGDRHFLEFILRYNEDDCYATFHLKNWLVQFSLISSSG